MIDGGTSVWPASGSRQGTNPAAVIAARDMAAERRRAAALDCAHHLELAEAHVAGIGLRPSRSMVAEDIRDLQGGTGHDRRGLCRRLLLGCQRSEPI
jgi:hypothetical protein